MDPAGIMSFPGQNRRLTILGGGMAGLSVGYYAGKAGLPFMILEAQNELGGNCRTFRYNGFAFDAGAHRFHDKDAFQTREIRALLGDDIREVCAPSRIYHDGVFIDFPLLLPDLLRKLGLPFFFKAALEVLKARLSPRIPDMNFEEFVLRAYGRTIAGIFLLGYTEKLWGVHPRCLSPLVLGGRLRGLDLATFLGGGLGICKPGAKHLDGSFYYPRQGIQDIPDALGNFCGRDCIRTEARISRVMHDGKTIQAVEVNGRDRIETDRVITTLPLTSFLGLLDPPPPPEVALLAGDLAYRDLVLCALFIDRPKISDCASFYFPDRGTPFSRVYEPKNRSAEMSPPDKTSLVAEFPCVQNDAVWNAADAGIAEMLGAEFIRMGLLRPADILGHQVVRMRHAYPVIRRNMADTLGPIFRYLDELGNLHVCGRGASFEYIHIHDLMRRGHDLIEDLRGGGKGAALGNPGQLQ
ncbi:MAG: FAD-dependent oxidoreductase [Candidatus Aminicenantes bacterium]|nr:FAD-dependent oxidoreductase [Candidatus Aminicenantes bacterium]